VNKSDIRSGRFFEAALLFLLMQVRRFVAMSLRLQAQAKSRLPLATGICRLI